MDSKNLEIQQENEELNRYVQTYQKKVQGLDQEMVAVRAGRDALKEELRQLEFKCIAREQDLVQITQRIRQDEKYYQNMPTARSTEPKHGKKSELVSHIDEGTSLFEAELKKQLGERDGEKDEKVEGKRKGNCKCVVF
jgi:hypothetical protein